MQGNEGQEALTFSEHAGEVYSVAISPDGQRVASAGPAPAGQVDAPVKVWDVRSGRVSVEFNGHKGIVFCVAWHPDGQRIASTGRDEERKLFVVKVWDARTGQEAFALPSDQHRDVRRGVQPRRPLPGHGGSESSRAGLGRADRHARSARSAPTTGRSRGWVSAATVGTWLRRAATGR